MWVATDGDEVVDGVENEMLLGENFLQTLPSRQQSLGFIRASAVFKRSTVFADRVESQTIIDTNTIAEDIIEQGCDTTSLLKAVFDTSKILNKSVIAGNTGYSPTFEVALVLGGLTIRFLVTEQRVI